MTILNLALMITVEYSFVKADFDHKHDTGIEIDHFLIRLITHGMLLKKSEIYLDKFKKVIILMVDFFSSKL